MTTKNISELDDFDNHIINIINQSKSEKSADVDAILNQIMKINDCRCQYKLPFSLFKLSA